MLEPFDDNITRGVFLNSGWDVVLATCKDRTYHCYSTQFLLEAKKSNEAGDKAICSVFRILGCLTSLLPNLDTSEEPYRPCLIIYNGRSATIDDFDETHLTFLGSIVADVTDAELQARIADILWLRKKDYRYAQIAVAAYLASAKNLEDFTSWPNTVDRLERSMQIAVRLGKNAPPYKSVVKHIESVLAACNGEDPLYLSLKLMLLLLERREGDSARYARLAEKLALRAEGENDWERAREHWEIKAKWHAKDSDREQERSARIAAAESYVKHADWILQQPQPQYILAAHWIQSAVEAMRRIVDTKERTLELHTRLLEYQQKAVNELVPFSSSIDVTSLATKAMDQVKGKALHEALLALTSLTSPPIVAELRAQALQHREDFVLQELFPRVFLNAAGRVIARQPQGEEERLRADMWHNASLFHQIHVQALINPARQQIMDEHSVRLTDFAQFVVNSPFVRPGREEIVGRGLFAGIRGDMLTAAHLLIPQIEDSVRFILFHKKIITSGLDDDGIQEEFNLNKMLTIETYTEPLKEVLGEDFIFDLRGLLIERYGANLRNDMAHGLITHDDYYSYAVCYLWWLALRLYAWPTVLKLALSMSDDETASSDKQEGDAQS